MLSVSPLSNEYWKSLYLINYILLVCVTSCLHRKITFLINWRDEEFKPYTPGENCFQSRNVKSAEAIGNRSSQKLMKKGGFPRDL